MSLSFKHALIRAYLWTVLTIQLQPAWAIRIRIRAYLESRERSKRSRTSVWRPAFRRKHA